VWFGAVLTGVASLETAPKAGECGILDASHPAIWLSCPVSELSSALCWSSSVPPFVFNGLYGRFWRCGGTFSFKPARPAAPLKRATAILAAVLASPCDIKGVALGYT
jgi:hypothetical protein